MEDAVTTDTSATMTVARINDEFRAERGADALEILDSSRTDILVNGTLAHALAFVERVLAYTGVVPADDVSLFRSALVENGAPCIIIRNAPVWSIASFYDNLLHEAPGLLAGDDNLYATIDRSAVEREIAATLNHEDGVLLFRGPLRLSTDVALVLNYKPVRACPWIHAFNPHFAIHIHDETTTAEGPVETYGRKQFTRLGFYAFLLLPSPLDKSSFVKSFNNKMSKFLYSAFICRLIGSNVFTRTTLVYFFRSRSSYAMVDEIFVNEGPDVYIRGLTRRARSLGVFDVQLARQIGGDLVPRTAGDGLEVDFGIDFADADNAYSFFSQYFAFNVVSYFANVVFEALFNAISVMAVDFGRWHIWMVLQRQFPALPEIVLSVLNGRLRRLLIMLGLNFDRSMVMLEATSLQKAIDRLPGDLARQGTQPHRYAAFMLLFNDAFNLFSSMHRIFYRRFFGQVEEYVKRVVAFSESREQGPMPRPVSSAAERWIDAQREIHDIYMNPSHGVASFPAPLALQREIEIKRPLHPSNIGASTQNYFRVASVLEIGWDHRRHGVYRIANVVAVFYDPRYTLVKEALPTADNVLTLLVVHSGDLETALALARVDEEFYFRGALRWLLYEEMAPADAVSGVLLALNRINFNATKFASFIQLPQIPAVKYVYSYGKGATKISLGKAITQVGLFAHIFTEHYRRALMYEMNAFRNVAVNHYDRIVINKLLEPFFRLFGVADVESNELLDATFALLRAMDLFTFPALVAIVDRIRAILQRMHYSIAFPPMRAPPYVDDVMNALVMRIDNDARKEKTMVCYSIFIRDAEPRKNLACSVIRLNLAAPDVGLVQ